MNNISGIKKVGRNIYKHWLTVAFLFGFVTDLFLLNRVDDVFDNLILLFYVLLATSSMLLLYVGVAEKAPNFLASLLKQYMPILMQYAFGGLLSGMLIFYGRSSDLIAGVPFLLLILAVIFFNEFINKRSDRLIYNLALYFIGLFSYVVLVIPVLIGKMGDLIFILSGLITIVIVSLVIKILARIIPNFVSVNLGRIIVVIGFIYIGFNSLYFTSLIPPIPLSLTELEIVHSVERIEVGGYRVKTEIQPWYASLPFIKPVIHPTENSIGCFARVYAPTRLSTEIFHRWEYKDENGAWQQHFRFGYEISGVNDGGYGGYTRAESFFTGIWRCSVETKRGQVLGREVVKIDTVGEAGETRVEIR